MPVDECLDRLRAIDPEGKLDFRPGDFARLDHSPTENDTHQRIRSSVPEARLTVVGSSPTGPILALAELDGIEVAGYVPDLGPYLDRAALMVAPLRYGAGMKSKVVEAMASGLAVVTTEVGAQGLDASDGEHLVVSDEPGDFARAVADLLGDPGRAEAIGRRAREHIGAIRGPEAVASALEASLVSIVGRGGPRLPPLACYRIHAANETARLRRDDGDLRDIRRAIKVMTGHLPGEVAAIAGVELRHYLRDEAMQAMYGHLGRGDARSALFAPRRLALRDPQASIVGGRGKLAYPGPSSPRLENRGKQAYPCHPGGSRRLRAGSP